MANEQGRADHVANTMPSPYYRFDGVNDTVTISRQTWLTYNSTHSVSMWVKIDAYPSDRTAIWENSGGGSDRNGISITASGTIGGGFYQGTGWTSSATTSVVPLDTWAHIVYTNTGSGVGGAVKVYLNGVPQTGSGVYVGGHTGSMRLGNVDNGQYFNGAIQGLKVYNTTLTADAVKKLYSGASVTGAVAEYDGASATTTTWFDKSDNGLNGTVNSATLENKSSVWYSGSTIGFKHHTTSTASNYDAVRKAVKNAMFDSKGVAFEAGAYANGNYYVMAGKNTGGSSYITFKLAVNRARSVSFYSHATNSADASSRSHGIFYSFNNKDWTALSSGSFAAGGHTLDSTIDLDAASVSVAGYAYSGNLYLRTEITGGAWTTLVGWDDIRFSCDGEGSISFNQDDPTGVQVAQFDADTTQHNIITANNIGFVKFTQSAKAGNIDNDVFEIMTTGDYGVKIKKAGVVQVHVTQDIRTSGSTSYARAYIDLNGNNKYTQLITNTNGEWDSIVIAGNIACEENDIIKVKFNASDILAIDSTSWNSYSFTWIPTKLK
jgi:hypothetical protein